MLRTPGQRFGLAGFLIFAALLVAFGMILALGAPLRDWIEDLRESE